MVSEVSLKAIYFQRVPLVCSDKTVDYKFSKIKPKGLLKVVVWNLKRASSSSQTDFCEALILSMGSNSLFLGSSLAVLLKHADHWGFC